MAGTSTRSYVLELPAGTIMGVLPRLVRSLQGGLGHDPEVTVPLQPQTSAIVPATTRLVLYKPTDATAAHECRICCTQEACVKKSAASVRISTHTPGAFHPTKIPGE